jgi:hypothetical protein
MATSPSTDNYTLGKGVIFLDKKDPTSGLYIGERDLGNAPSFSFNVALEKLDHFSSRGGLKAKDKEIISQLTPSLTFTLDEVNKDNLALLTFANLNEVTQTAGSVVQEVVTAHAGLRSDLSKRNIMHWQLPYDDAAADNALFVEGEVVTGAGGATGVVLVVTGTATTGTLTIAKTNDTAFVDDEAITGSIAGAAEVMSATGGTVGTGTPIILVQDATDTTTYVAGTDYELSTTLKDDVIGRVKVIDGGSITEGDVLHVTFGYLAATYTEVQAFANTQIEGKLRFISDNPAGGDQELEVWRVSLTPSGDTALIGDDWSTLGFSGEILKDEIGHPDSPYFNITLA